MHKQSKVLQRQQQKRVSALFLGEPANVQAPSHENSTASPHRSVALKDARTGKRHPVSSFWKGEKLQFQQLHEKILKA
jgi:hypothetical protein